MAERDNELQWDRKPGHYEVWYATLSHRASGTGFWIRYTLEAPLLGHGEAYAQLWFARFDGSDASNTFGVHRRLPIAELRSATHPFRIAIGDAELRDDGMRGAIVGGGHEARWDITFAPSIVTQRILPRFAYGRRFASTKVVSPNLDVRAHGSLTVDGRTYVLDGDPLGQSHLWGRKHAYAWGWGHCNGFDDGEAALEALSVRLRRGPVLLPTLTVAKLIVDGEELAFSSPLLLPLGRGDFRTGRYRLAATRPDARIEATFQCAPEQMLLTEYVDPDGDAVWCHNSCCADLELRLFRRGALSARFHEARRLRAIRTAHFEWAGRNGDVSRVRKLHQPVA